MNGRFLFEERDYQKEAVQNVMEAFADGKDSVMLESPVGAGKTVMGLMIAGKLQKQFGENFRINWVAARRHILKQTQNLNESYFHCNINFVSVFNSNPPPADFVILDEAHHEATQSCLDMYEKNGNSRSLGLSATPLRTDRMRLSFQKTVQCCGIQQLINMGVLAQYHSFKLPEWSAEIAGNIFCQHPERWGKTLVFFHTVNECRLFQSMLAEHGIHCEIVTGKSNKDAQLEAFAAGEFQVVANVSVLSEGFDLPELQTVFLRDSSRLAMIQMAGRGLRSSQHKTHCNLIQSSNSPCQIERIAVPKESFRYMRGHWLSCSGDTAMINEMLTNSMQLLCKRKNKLPYCLTRNHNPVKQVSLIDHHSRKLNIYHSLSE